MRRAFYVAVIKGIREWRAIAEPPEDQYGQLAIALADAIEEIAPTFNRSKFLQAAFKVKEDE